MSHLSVVIDLSPTQWHLSAQPPPANTYPLSLSTFLSQLLAFLNSHIAAKHENTLAVFGAFPGKSVMLYPSTDTAAENSVGSLADANSYLPLKIVDTTMVKQIQDELEELGELQEESPCALVGAVSKALCYINRTTISSSAPNAKANKNDPSGPSDPRILILSVSPDLSTSYIPMMNTIFSAQKLKVTIDVCKIYGQDTVFLQQAAHLTGGSYIYLERRDALLQYLTMSFLSPPSVRKILSVPTQDKIDFRAACFCHKNIIDVGFVCSVCLSIFCQPVPVCSTCKTKFPIKTLQRLNATRPLLPSSTPAPSSRPSPSSTPASTSQPTSTVPTTNANTNGSSRSASGLPHTSTIRVSGGGSGASNGSRIANGNARAGR